MKTRSLKRLSCSLFVATLLATVAQHALAIQMVIQPTATTNTVECCGRTGTMAINGSGLSAPSLVNTGDPIPVVWPTHNGDPSLMYLSNNIKPATITFDLGAIYADVYGFHVWNYNENSGNPAFFTLRGMRNVTVDFSTVSSAGPFTNAIVYSGGTAFAQANGLAEPGEDKTFPPINTRWIRFVGDNFGAEGYTGLSEVRFFTAPPVPEPSTLVLLSLGLVAVSWRRRQRASARRQR